MPFVNVKIIEGVFRYHPRKIFCPAHHRIQENIPWADSFARITYRFEYVEYGLGLGNFLK